MLNCNIGLILPYKRTSPKWEIRLKNINIAFINALSNNELVHSVKLNLSDLLRLNKWTTEIFPHIVQLEVASARLNSNSLMPIM
jgi:hypothetical protein